ncbi:MAG: hypothetical protein IJJ41_07820 [Clostridia bacterium]|nr:hypothetical protein [Clostridia bacterium]
MRKIYKIIPFILIVAIGILSIRLFVVFVPQKAEKADTAEGVKYLHNLEAVGGNKADDIVRKAREKYEGAERRKKIAQAIKEGNFEYAMKDVLIVGDSIMKAMYEYGIVDESQILAEIGAGTAFLEDNIEDIVAANPKVLVLHFGENQLSTEEYAPEYAKQYGELIQTLKKKLPNTKIYVDSIFPVEEKAYSAEPYTKNIAVYNQELEKMAKDIGVHYIDYDEMFASFDKNYFDADGIHPVASFYSEQFLPYMLTEVGVADE